MDGQYDEEVLLAIAGKCGEFDHIISAMGYGYSLLNVSANNFQRRCSDCVHWLGGSCNIFRESLEGEATL
jgi:hypothetical protein